MGIPKYHGNLAGISWEYSKNWILGIPFEGFSSAGFFA
jgi:hypothetical protein